MNSTKRICASQLAIVALVWMLGANAADRESDARLLAQATPAPKTDETKQPATIDKGTSHSDAKPTEPQSDTLDADEQEMAKHVEMMGKRMRDHGMEMEKMGKQMRERGTRMHKQGMSMKKSGPAKGMNMEKMNMDMNKMDKNLSESDTGMDEMEKKHGKHGREHGHGTYVRMSARCTLTTEGLQCG